MTKNINDKKIGKLTFRFNQPEKEVAMDIPIAGGTAVLTSKRNDTVNHEVRVSVNNKEKFSFKIEKSICAIGGNNNSTYYKLLSGNMERSSITPDYPGDDFKEKFDNFIFDMQTANGDILEVLNSTKWKERDGKKEIISWAEASGSIEKFSNETNEKAKEILNNGNLIEEMLDLAGLKAVGQRSNTALVILISLSSFLKDSIHHIFTGPPGTSKSTITDTIFDIFPNRRKESIGKSSTPASLLNMTTYKEGHEVLSRKLIRLGDLGNEDEIKAALPLLSIIKEMMSEKRYDKTISVPDGDSHTTKRLTLDGLGSVHLSTIESNVESQYDSRAIISSPDDTKETAEEIKNHQLNDLELQLKKKEFDKRRPAVASAIDMICYGIEDLEREYKSVQIINPYASHMNEIFNIDGSKNANRNRNHIRDIPKSVTLANLKHTEFWVHTEDEDIKILVSPEEYLYALKIIGKPILKMLSDISPQQQSYIRFIDEKYLIDGTIDLRCYDDYEKCESYEIKQSAWAEKIASEVSFTKKDITEGLGVSETTASRILDNLVSRKIIFKHLHGRKNYYFPTEEFVEYSNNFAPNFYTDDELNIDGEVYQIAKDLYDSTVHKLKKAGYEKRDLSHHIVFGG